VLKKFGKSRSGEKRIQSKNEIVIGSVDSGVNWGQRKRNENRRGKRFLVTLTKPGITLKKEKELKKNCNVIGTNHKHDI